MGLIYLFIYFKKKIHTSAIYGEKGGGVFLVFFLGREEEEEEEEKVLNFFFHIIISILKLNCIFLR